MSERIRKMANTVADENTVTQWMMQGPFFDEALLRLMTRPIDIWLQCQAGMLKVAQPATTQWIERRRDAAMAGFATLEKLRSCSDLNELAALQRDCLEDTVRRLDADLRALADHVLALSQETLTATRSTGETSAEVAAFAVAPIRRAAQESQEPQRREASARSAAA